MFALHLGWKLRTLQIWISYIYKTYIAFIKVNSIFIIKAYGIYYIYVTTELSLITDCKVLSLWWEFPPQYSG